MNPVVSTLDVAESNIVQESHVVFARHARTFRWAAWFLPASIRDDVAVVYAFCRWIDELADTFSDAQGLQQVMEELEGKREASSLVAAYLGVAQRFCIPMSASLDLLRGVHSDLHRVQIKDDAELIRYCYCVAGTIGVMMCGLLRISSPQALAFAIDLGIGMQLTNIARDVAEDAQLSRVYLPKVRLEQAGTDSKALLNEAVPRAKVSVAVNGILDLADRYYASARQGFHYIPWRSRVAICIAARNYQAIGWKLRNLGGDAFAGRTRLTLLARLWNTVIAVGISMASRRNHGHVHDSTLHSSIRDFYGVHE